MCSDLIYSIQANVSDYFFFWFTHLWETYLFPVCLPLKNMA
jgi:hypothetical protein